MMIYKEVTQTMTMSSAHTKHHLEDMHESEFLKLLRWCSRVTISPSRHRRHEAS